MSNIIPFPRTRDRAFVLRHAYRAWELNHRAAEKHISVQIDVQRSTMLRRGVDIDVVEQQCRALENAIRAELWRLVMGVGGAA
jgi:flagellar motility protein MotE (MotC chaperone)